MNLGVTVRINVILRLDRASKAVSCCTWNCSEAASDKPNAVIPIHIHQPGGNYTLHDRALGSMPFVLTLISAYKCPLVSSVALSSSLAMQDWWRVEDHALAGLVKWWETEVVAASVFNWTCW